MGIVGRAWATPLAAEALAGPVGDPGWDSDKSAPTPTGSLGAIPRSPNWRRGLRVSGRRMQSRLCPAQCDRVPRKADHPAADAGRDRWPSVAITLRSEACEVAAFRLVLATQTPATSGPRASAGDEPGVPGAGGSALLIAESSYPEFRITAVMLTRIFGCQRFQ